jgi:hypothetical protein
LIYARKPGHRPGKAPNRARERPLLSGAKLLKFLKYFGLASFQFKLRKLPPSRGRARFFGDFWFFSEEHQAKSTARRRRRKISPKAKENTPGSMQLEWTFLRKVPTGLDRRRA